MDESEPNEHITKDPIDARQGSKTKVNFVILIVSTLAAVVAVFALLIPGFRS